MSNIPQEFILNVTAEASGESYKGVFKVRPRLSHRASLTMDQFRRDLLGSKSEAASKDAENIARVFSKIWAHLEDAPSWWVSAKNGLDLLDEEPVAEVYKQVLRIEMEAIEALQKKGTEAAEALK